MKPWFADPTAASTAPDPTKTQRSKAWNDPLSDMNKYLKHKKIADEKKKEDENKKNKQKKTIEDLRKERLEREKYEKDKVLLRLMIHFSPIKIAKILNPNAHPPHSFQNQSSRRDEPRKYAPSRDHSGQNQGRERGGARLRDDY